MEKKKRRFYKLIYVSRSTKKRTQLDNTIMMRAQRGLRSACAFSHSDQYLRCTCTETGSIAINIVIERQAMNDQTNRLCIVIRAYVRAHDFVGIIVLRLMYNKIH